MVAPWRSTKGAEPCAVKAARTVLNGGDGETGRKALRPVPTQLGYRRRLKRGVRQCGLLSYKTARKGGVAYTLSWVPGKRSALSTFPLSTHKISLYPKEGDR